ncbi:putative CC-NBS-LRR resistance protein, partial [Trifolium pratense]
ALPELKALLIREADEIEEIFQSEVETPDNCSICQPTKLLPDTRNSMSGFSVNNDVTMKASSIVEQQCPREDEMIVSKSRSSSVASQFSSMPSKGSSHSEFVELLQDLCKCGFDKDWLDGVEKHTLFPGLQVSQDALQNLLDSKHILTQHAEDLKHQLASTEAVLESITIVLHLV